MTNVNVFLLGVKIVKQFKLRILNDILIEYLNRLIQIVAYLDIICNFADKFNKC